MKKVGILTHYYNSSNYGGVLQACALQYIIESENFECHQICFDIFDKKTSNQQIIGLDFFQILYKCINKIKQKIKLIINRKREKEFQHRYFNEFLTRKECFFQFRENINHSKQKYNNVTIHDCIPDYDIFVVGSDQVWHDKSEVFFLSFVPDKVPKIAYAASIARSHFDKSYFKFIESRVSRFNFVSVREESAIKVIKPYTSQKVISVLDPTFLLKKQEWDEIKNDYSINEPYIFVYLLGNNKEHRNRIKKIANSLNLKIVGMPFVHLKYENCDENFFDYGLYDAGPAEFISIIDNAAMVITDSFHGCVFSIIYHKKFWALKRHKDTEKENMNSRLYTLFSNLGLKERLLDDDQKLTKGELLSEIDYEAVDEKLEVLRKDSMDFLENALSESVKMIEENQKKQKSKGN